MKHSTGDLKLTTFSACVARLIGAGHVDALIASPLTATVGVCHRCVRVPGRRRDTEEMINHLHLDCVLEQHGPVALWFRHTGEKGSSLEIKLACWGTVPGSCERMHEDVWRYSGNNYVYLSPTAFLRSPPIRDDGLVDSSSTIACCPLVSSDSPGRTGEVNIRRFK